MQAHIRPATLKLKLTDEKVDYEICHPLLVDSQQSWFLSGSIVGLEHTHCLHVLHRAVREEEWVDRSQIYHSALQLRDVYMHLAMSSRCHLRYIYSLLCQIPYVLLNFVEFTFCEF